MITVYYGNQHGRGGSQPRPAPGPSPKQPKRVAPSRPNPRRKPGRKNPQRGNPAKPGQPARPGPGPKPGGPSHPVYIPPFKPRPGPMPGPKPGPQKWTANPAWKRGKVIFDKASRFLPLFKRGMDLIDFYNNMDNLQAYFQFRGQDALIMEAQHGDWCYSYNPAMDVPSIDCGFRQGYTYGSAYFPCSNKHDPLQPPAGVLPASFVAFFNPSFIGAGPLQGGFAGCERINTAHVWIWNRLSDPALWGVNIRRRIQPLPDIQFDPAIDPLGVPRPYPYPQRPVKYHKPYEAPAYEYDLGSMAKPKASPVAKPVLHRYVPPPPRTRERKLRFADNPLIAAAAGLYGGLTELGDFFDALGGAFRDKRLEAGYRRQKTLQDKAMYLADHWKEIYVADALENWGSDYVKDAVIGKLNRAAAKAAAGTGYWVSPRGPGISRAGWSGPHQGGL